MASKIKSLWKAIKRNPKGMLSHMLLSPIDFLDNVIYPSFYGKLSNRMKKKIYNDRFEDYLNDSGVPLDWRKVVPHDPSHIRAEDRAAVWAIPCIRITEDFVLATWGQCQRDGDLRKMNFFVKNDESCGYHHS